MKALLAANSVEAIESSVRVLARMKFDPCSVDVLSVVEPFYPYAPMAGPGFGMPVTVDLSELQKSVEKHCGGVAETVCAELRERGVECRAHVESGKVSSTFMHFAKEWSSDLIVVGGGDKGPIEAFVFGSVTRELSSHSDKSFLIGRGEVASHGRIKVLFATDHSAYADSAIEELIRLQPTGIARLTVLSVYDLSVELPLGAALAAPETESVEEQQLVDELHEKNRAAAARFAHLGCEVNCLEVRGNPMESIPDVFEQTESELLVLGARGHGFFDRLVLGSVSHHMVATQHFSVLVLRPS